MLERESVLAELAGALAQTARSRGGCAIVEGAWGSGRSSVVKETIQMAARSRVHVLSAAGSELEQDVAWGVAGQLLGPAWPRWQPPDARWPAQPPDDPDELCRALVALGGDRTRADAANAAELARGLSTAVTRLSRALRSTGGRGLLLTVDDAHRADRESLRLLAQLARSVRQLPIFLLLAVRSGEALVDPAAAAALRAHARRLPLTALSPTAVARRVERTLPAADPHLAAECARLTAGNPALLSHLVDELSSAHRPGEPRAIPAGTVPEPVRESVAERVARLSAENRGIAESIAVLGPEATVRRVGALAGVDSDTVLAGAEALRDADLLSPQLPLAFAAPLLEAAVLSSLTPFARARARLGAARLLRAEDADASTIARQLLDAPADQDPAMIPPLREAAGGAVDDHDLERAAALLRRALAERPSAELRLELMSELAWTEADTRELTEQARLRIVRRPDLPPTVRGRLALGMGRAMYAHRRPAAALPFLTAGIEAALTDGAPPHEGVLSDALLATKVICASLVADLVPEALEDRRALLEARSAPPAPITRAAIAHTVVHDALRGASRTEVRALAELAWGDGTLLASGPFVRLGAPLLCAALALADEVERALEILEAIDLAPRTPWIDAAQGALSCVRSWVWSLRGDVARGLEGATAVLGRPSMVEELTLVAARTVAVLCLVESDRLEMAEHLLSEYGPSAAGGPLGRAIALVGLSHARLAAHRPREALDAAVEAGRAVRQSDPSILEDPVGWRSSAALALLSLGERSRAQVLAREALSQAAETDNGRTMTQGLYVLGLTLGDDGLNVLARAVEVGDLNGPRLAHAHALVEHGAALRRTNRRAESREPLRRGLDHAHRGGVRRLEKRARAELVASGARPRRPATTGVASLTASQRRVAELAAGGLTTRQMADALFVTPKTVEFHLRETYRKLEVNSRAELTRALELP